MDRRILAGVVLLTLGALGQSASATALGGAAAPGADTVHVAPPTGEPATDRASILAALEQVQPGGTVQFAPGTYLVGEGIDVAVPRVTLLGHGDGTVLRGCDAGEFTELEHAVEHCNGLELSGGHQTVRGLTFELAWHGLVVGCCGDSHVPGRGAYLIEDNTFRESPNGIRVVGQWTEPAVIRGNRFINTYHAVVVNGMTAHVLDNDVTVPESDRVPNTRHPGGAMSIGGWADFGAPACDGNVIAGNRISGHPDAIVILLFAGAACRDNEIRGNVIEAARVSVPPASRAVTVRDSTDSTVGGVPIAVINRVGGTAENNRIEGNRIMGAVGLAIEITGGSGNRIAGNTISGVARREPFPGNTLDRRGPEWGSANGAGIWISAGSDENEIVGNVFDGMAAHAIVLEGDRNRVELRSSADSVRDLGTDNQVTALAYESGSVDHRQDPEPLQPHIRAFLDEVSGREQRRSAPPGSGDAGILGSEGCLPGADGVRRFYRVRGTGPDTVDVLHGGPSPSWRRPVARHGRLDAD